MGGASGALACGRPPRGDRRVPGATDLVVRRRRRPVVGAGRPGVDGRPRCADPGRGDVGPGHVGARPRVAVRRAPDGAASRGRSTGVGDGVGGRGRRAQPAAGGGAAVDRRTARPCPRVQPIVPRSATHREPARGHRGSRPRPGRAGDPVRQRGPPHPRAGCLVPSARPSVALHRPRARRRSRAVSDGRRRLPGGRAHAPARGLRSERRLRPDDRGAPAASAAAASPVPRRPGDPRRLRGAHAVGALRPPRRRHGRPDPGRGHPRPAGLVPPSPRPRVDGTGARRPAAGGVRGVPPLRRRLRRHRRALGAPRGARPAGTAGGDARRPGRRRTGAAAGLRGHPAGVVARQRPRRPRGGTGHGLGDRRRPSRRHRRRPRRLRTPPPDPHAPRVDHRRRPGRGVAAAPGPRWPSGRLRGGCVRDRRRGIEGAPAGGFPPRPSGEGGAGVGGGPRRRGLRRRRHRAAARARRRPARRRGPLVEGRWWCGGPRARRERRRGGGPRRPAAPPRASRRRARPAVGRQRVRSARRSRAPPQPRAARTRPSGPPGARGVQRRAGPDGRSRPAPRAHDPQRGASRRPSNFGPCASRSVPAGTT